ncbi:hypothetical protein VTH06DRAFT_153 [Thermothelomyces fergusii]
MAPRDDESSPLPVPSSDFDRGASSHGAQAAGAGDSAADCPFCHIASVFPPYDPADPPRSSSGVLRPERAAPQPAAFVVLSTPRLVGFLDIMPLSAGHVLLCPRAHRPRLTDATAAEAAELGRFLRVLSAAVGAATGVRDWNVVQNNGAAAAQVVPHMHFHVIPRPELRHRRSERFTATMFGRGQREELDEDEAVVLAEKVRAAVAEIVRKDGEGEGEGRSAKL